MEVWGHRGSRMPGPENTPVAVRAALAAGAQGSEIDVRTTVDGELVCIHDPLVAALDDAPVSRLTARQLARAGVPSLPEMLAAGAGGTLVIEVKNDPAEPGYSPDAQAASVLVQTLATSVPGPRILISSFDHTALDVARVGGWPVALLTYPGVAVEDGLAFAAGRGYQELHAHVSAIVDAAVVRAVHEAGLRLAGWTVTTTREVLRLRDLGVDSAICDDPAEAVIALS